MSYSIFPRKLETKGGRAYAQIWGTQRAAPSRLGMRSSRALRSKAIHAVELTWENVEKSYLSDLWDLVESTLGGAQLVVTSTFQQEAKITVAYDDSTATMYVDDTTHFQNWTITVDSANKYLNFQNDTGVGELTATLTEATYSPNGIAAEIATQMSAASATNYTCTYSLDDDLFTIAETQDGSETGRLDLLWFSGTNAANTVGADIGYDISRDRSGGVSYTSDFFKSTFGNRILVSDSSDNYNTKDILAVSGTDAEAGTLSVNAPGVGNTYSIGSLVEPCFNASIILPEDEFGARFEESSKFAGKIVTASIRLVEAFNA